MNFKFGVITKNQILASMIVLMLVVAGYLNYTYDPTKNYETELTGVIGNNLGDAYFVDNSNVDSNVEEVGEKIEATAKLTTAEEYFSETRMERDNSFAEQLETYEKILYNNNLSSEDKKFASDEITNINNRKNAIIIAENLIKLKGFKDVVILINEENVNVIVRSDELTDSEALQIQNILTSELKVKIENLHIRTI